MQCDLKRAHRISTISLNKKDDKKTNQQEFLNSVFRNMKLRDSSLTSFPVFLMTSSIWSRGTNLPFLDSNNSHKCSMRISVEIINSVKNGGYHDNKERSILTYDIQNTSNISLGKVTKFQGNAICRFGVVGH